MKNRPHDSGEQPSQVVPESLPDLSEAIDQAADLLNLNDPVLRQMADVERRTREKLAKSSE